MAKAADITTKRMIGAAPEVWIKWTAPIQMVTACELIASEYQWLGRASDAVLRVSSPDAGEFILIIEVQLYFDWTMPVRLRAYSALAEEREGLPVYPVVINLLPPRPGTRIVDRYESNFLGLQARQDFRVINVWEIDLAEIWAADPTLWPLAPLARGGQEEVVLVRAKDQVAADETLRHAGRVPEVEAQLATLGSFVFTREVIDRVFGDHMSDWVVQSPMYKDIVRETRLVALQEGRQEGRLAVLVPLLQGRFGALGDELLGRLRELSAERLDALADAFYSIQNRDELALWLTRAEATTQNGQNGGQNGHG